MQYVSSSVNGKRLGLRCCVFLSLLRSIESAIALVRVRVIVRSEQTYGGSDFHLTRRLTVRPAGRSILVGKYPETP